MKTPAAIVHRELPPDHPGRRRAGHPRGPGAAGLAAHRGLAAGLKETIPYFAARLKQENIPVAASLNSSLGPPGRVRPGAERLRD